ncbi:MAG: alanine/ornithine racemase family PLP-dependent enzyme [Rectinemataceae bacterium]|nr:alanine/ornithine racemase family PLP-dependent enzyme [Spirochaetaceae bacterium]
MKTPCLEIRYETLVGNTRSVVEFCSRYGVEVWGVTKGCCGMPEVARAMLEGGVAGIGESRTANLQRIRAAGITAPTLMLRLPHISEAPSIVEQFDMSLNSELATIEALNSAAAALRKRHGIILMVDLGDLREGLWPDRVLATAEQVMRLDHIELLGVGTNLTCYGGVIPTEANLGLLVRLAQQVEQMLGLRLRFISGGNTSTLPLMAAGGLPAGINMLRIGEAILLGTESIHRTPWPGTRQDAFVLHAEVIECATKPSVPIGTTGEDGFGGHPVFQDRGLIRRAIVNIGRQDVLLESLACIEPGMDILGASSDHLILDVTHAEHEVRVGDIVSFRIGYGTLLQAMTSPYVCKRIV